MKDAVKLSGCANCAMSRRGFLAAGCTACAGAILNPTPAYAAAKEKMRIRIIYSLHAEVQPGPDWPNVGFDFGPHMQRINEALSNGCPDFEFLPAMAKGEEQAKKILAQGDADNIDGYVVYQMNCWNRVIQTIADSGKPVIYADFQYGGSGGFLIYNASYLRSQASNVGFVASTRMKDLINAVRCFEVLQHGGSLQDFSAATAQLRQKHTPRQNKLPVTPDPLSCLTPKECVAKLNASKILAVRNQEADILPSVMGIPVEQITFSEVNEAWEFADKEESIAIADRWQNNAAVVDGVSLSTLRTSAAMYLGMKAVLKKHDANAITINCLGGFYGGHIHAYPCLGFHELCNEGLVGACECDISSTATMLAFSTLAKGRPGFISDPVMDSAKRQIIYAHCVAPNRIFGPEGDTNPYEVLTHSEDRQGASVRSILPLNYMTTTLEVSEARKEILFHQGKAVENNRDDRACRTKLAVDPAGDFEKLFTMWDQWSWHRVTFYGDLKEPVYTLADTIGWKVVEEA